MADPNLRKQIVSAFKLNGFTIRKEACSILLTRLGGSSSSEVNKFINDVVVLLQKHQQDVPVIEKDQLEAIIREIESNGADESESVFSVINVFEIPKYTYNFERKKFYKDVETTTKIELFSSPTWRAQYLIRRYEVILQRTLRNKLFATESLPGFKKDKVFKLKYIENLLSSSSRVDEVIVLGLLTQLKEGTYYLEDLTGVVPLNLTSTRFHSGLFTEHTFVLAEGYYEDKILNVMGLVMPPSESQSISRVYFGNVNTFGGNQKTCFKNSEKLIKLEQENEDGMIIFLSDVWLDDLKVMTKLKALFSGYNDFPPIAIVLMGEFLSCPNGYEHSVQMKSVFKSLAELISQYPELLESCKFIFVPGNSDTPSTNILPRPPIPDYVTEEIRSIMGDKAIFTSNPCRIQYCTQEIVVMRHNLVTKMCRNAVHFPDVGDIPDHLAKTLLSQCTLCPLSIGIQPLYWQHADALNLYPTPDLVVIADHFQPYTRKCQECQFVNPGSFPRTEFSFKVYVPSTRSVEDSQIPKED